MSYQKNGFRTILHNHQTSIMRGPAGPPGEKGDKDVDRTMVKYLVFRLVMLTKRLAYYVCVKRVLSEY